MIVKLPVEDKFVIVDVNIVVTSEVKAPIFVPTKKEAHDIVPAPVTEADRDAVPIELIPKAFVTVNVTSEFTVNELIVPAVKVNEPHVALAVTVT